MRQFQMFAMGLLGLSFVFSGCARITTQVVEKPRVDQEAGGNRGYLVGSAPAGAPRRTTRKIIQTDVELPTGEELNPWRVKKPATPPALDPTGGPSAVPSMPSYEEPPAWQEPIPELSEEPSLAEPPAAPQRRAGTTYAVQKGDTLQKISDRFYGTTRKWGRIYEANRDALKSPDRVYPGQELFIPEAEAPPAGGTFLDENEEEAASGQARGPEAYK